MANIWHSIVNDTQKTIDKYFNEILDDLLHNLTSNQWRVRISCCQALADFFRGNRSLLVGFLFQTLLFFFIYFLLLSHFIKNSCLSIRMPNRNFHNFGNLYFGSWTTYTKVQDWPPKLRAKLWPIFASEFATEMREKLTRKCSTFRFRLFFLR